MITRLLPVVIVCVFAAAADAQLTSDRYSPINTFGRYHGFGFSDGYHSCKDGRSNNSVSFWKPWESMSSFYGSPTQPPSNRAMNTTSSSLLYSPARAYHANPGFAQPVEEVFTQPSAPAYVPQQMVPAAPLQVPPLNRAPQNSYESVPPAPLQLQSSPSDRELPAPRKSSEPTAQRLQVPKVSRSLLQ
jgi:hypothetical protein